MKHMSLNQYKKFATGPSKYGNRRCECDGHKFDSLFEMNYYKRLRILEKAGKIKNLKLQVPFVLQPAFKFEGKTIRAIKYVADFTYDDEDGNEHIVDTKGFVTDVYAMKKKMMQYRGYKIEEVNERRYKT